MFKTAFAASVLLGLAACAHQPSDNSKNRSQANPDRIDNAYRNDGYCEAHEARRPDLYPECRQPAAQRRENARVPGEDRVRDIDAENLGQEIDRDLPNLGSNRLGL